METTTLEVIKDEREGLPSASSMERIKLCPPSMLRSQNAPVIERDSTPDSESGDRIHAALANWISAWVVESKCVGAAPEVVAFCDDLSSDEATTAEIMAAQAVKVIGAWLLEAGQITDSIIEKRMWIVNDFGAKQASVKPDIVLVAGANALALDWKSGHNAVSNAAQNIQLRTLVLAIAYETGALSVRVGIIQSWAGKPHTCDYSEESIDRAYAEFITILDNAGMGDALRANPGTEQCRYCAAKLTCAEHQRWVQGSMPATIRELPLAKEWGPTEWAFFLDNKGAAKKWLEEKEAEAKRILKESPHLIPSHSLKTGTARESIGHVDVVYTRFVAAGGDAQNFAAAAGISKKALDELIGTNLGLKGTARKKLMEGLIEGCTVKGNEPEPTIVKSIPALEGRAS